MPPLPVISGGACIAALARSDTAPSDKSRSSQDGVVKGVDLTWHEATRHSFISRNLKAGIQLEEVSAAVGYASPATTKRHYGHFIRKAFNPALRQGLTPGRGK